MTRTRLSAWSIRTRLLLLVLLAIVPPVGLMVHLAWHHRQERIDEIAAQVLTLARLAAADHEKMMEGVRQMLGVLTQMPALWGGDRRVCHSFLVDLLATSPRYNAVVYVDLDGWVRCTSLKSPPVVNLVDRDYFQRALAANGFVTGEMAAGQITKLAALPFARPFTDATGQPRGVVVASVRLDWLDDIFKLAELPATATLIATDRRGTVLARRPYDSAWIGRSAPWTAELDSMVKLQPHLVDRGDEFVGLVPIRSSDLFVAVTVSKETATAAGDRLFALYLLAIAASTVLALALAWTVGEITIGRRIRALTQVANELRAGNLAARLNLAPGGGEFEQLRATFEHMSIELRRRERELHDRAEAFRRHALHDALTGLPNRVLFRDRLEWNLTRAHRDGSCVAVLALDLDHFKDVNDVLGHDVGDRLLVEVASRLRSCVRDCDTVARLGGDEFALLINDMVHPEEVTQIAERIIASLNEFFDLDGHRVHIGTSIGITVFPQDAADAGQLLKCADLALYQVKDDGRGTCQFFTPSLRTGIEHRKSIENQLRQAVERDELLLHYQPQVDLKTGAVIGVEALLRWNHPTRGLMAPTLFLPIAEASGLILAIGEWVLRTACAQAASWWAAGLPRLRVAINLSPAQLWRQDLPALVGEALEATGLSPEYLVLEITEDVVLTRAKGDVAHTLRRLCQMGVGLAWDDFGTGHSSLVHLKSLPVKQVKIDRSFVHDLRGNGDGVAVVRGVIGLAQSLRRTVTAEGVETAEQLALLAELGCDEAQGYHCGRPMPAPEAGAFLRAHCGADRAIGGEDTRVAGIAAVYRGPRTARSPTSCVPGSSSIAGCRQAVDR